MYYADEEEVVGSDRDSEVLGTDKEYVDINYVTAPNSTSTSTECILYYKLFDSRNKMYYYLRVDYSRTG